MPWTNQDLILYHGTDDSSAAAILSQGVDLRLCSSFTDFGRGFYTTTNAAQATVWAHLRTLRLRQGGRGAAKPAVLRVFAGRDFLAGLESLVFPRPARETAFPDFVRYCRGGGTPHRGPGGRSFQVVYGPVAQWQGLFEEELELFVLNDCDQASFHDASHLVAGGPLLDGADVRELPWPEDVRRARSASEVSPGRRASEASDASSS